MLEWLLKYPPSWYAGGTTGIAWPWQAYVSAVLGSALLLLWLGGYRRVRGAGGSYVLRVLLAAVMLLALARPTLTVEVPEPIRGHVAVLLDDSLSLRVPDAGGGTAAARMDALSGEGPDSLTGTLASRFDVRAYRYGEGVQPLAPRETLRHADPRSDLGGGLLHVATGQDADSLTAVVVVGDGAGVTAGPARRRLDDALLALRAAGVPVHVVPLGGVGAGPDLEVRAVRTPRRALVRDAFDVEVEIGRTGARGERTALVIEDDGVIVDRHEITLPADRDRFSVRRRVSFSEAGRRLLTVRVEPVSGERVLENNRIERSIDVIDGPLRVLHFEGEPRFAVKFIRRAVAGDPAIHLASLVRAADNKYIRLGVDSPGDLAEGFPRDRAELFRYDVLILGSVPAELLTREQQEAIRDFVARRGGGLIFLGGRRAFAEGGYAGTLLADLMPVTLPEPAPDFRVEVRVKPTPAGVADPLLDLGSGDGRPVRFSRLPGLTVLHPLYRAKPGAVVLLTGATGGDDPVIVLARQRYGRGRVMVFDVSDSWRWQMHVHDPVEDRTHERLWRQLLRDLGRQAGGRVRTTLSRGEATPGHSVRVAARALDPLFRPMQAAQLSLAVTTPAGDIRRYPMATSAADPTEYIAAFVPGPPGRYDLAVELSSDGSVVATGREFVDVSSGGAEFRALADGRQRLERIAAATGGRVFDAPRVAGIADAIDDARGTRPVLRRLPLWDAPVLLLALLLLACGDWVLRRSRNLA